MEAKKEAPPSDTEEVIELMSDERGLQ